MSRAPPQHNESRFQEFQCPTSLRFSDLEFENNLLDVQMASDQLRESFRITHVM